MPHAGLRGAAAATLLPPHAAHQDAVRVRGLAALAGVLPLDLQQVSSLPRVPRRRRRLQRYGALRPHEEGVGPAAPPPRVVRLQPSPLPSCRLPGLADPDVGGDGDAEQWHTPER